MSDVVQVIRSAVQASEPQNLQDVLWGITGATWWTGYAIVSAIGALCLFIALLRETELNALSFGRLIWLGGMIVGIFVNYNSACQFISGAMAISSGTFMSILTVTHWCHRRGTPWQKATAIFREIVWRTEGARK